MAKMVSMVLAIAIWHLIDREVRISKAEKVELKK